MAPRWRSGSRAPTCWTVLAADAPAPVLLLLPAGHVPPGSAANHAEVGAADQQRKDLKGDARRRIGKLKATRKSQLYPIFDLGDGEMSGHVGKAATDRDYTFSHRARPRPLSREPRVRDENINN